MKNSPDMLGNGSGTEDRFAGQMGYRGAARRDGLGLPEQSSDGRSSAPSLDDMATMPTMLEPPPVSTPSMSLNDLDSLAEPVFPPVGWLDDSPTGTLADHPLLRGLLLELPPKGTVPAPGLAGPVVRGGAIDPGAALRAVRRPAAPTLEPPVRCSDARTRPEDRTARPPRRRDPAGDAAGHRPTQRRAVAGRHRRGPGRALRVHRLQALHRGLDPDHQLPAHGDDFRQIVVDYAAEAASFGAVYLEGIFSPPERVARGLDWDEIFTGYAEGAVEAAEVLRRDGAVHAGHLPQRLPGRPGRGVRARLGALPRPWRRRARHRRLRAGLSARAVPRRPSRSRATAVSAFVPHAGEAAGPESIREALDMGAHRIRHGIRAVDDPELLGRDRRARASCSTWRPTSNLRTGVVARDRGPPAAGAARGRRAVLDQHRRPGDVRHRPRPRLRAGRRTRRDARPTRTTAGLAGALVRRGRRKPDSRTLLNGERPGLLVRRRGWRRLPQAGLLRGQPDQVGRVEDQVAPPQPGRFQAEPPQPLERVLLHPRGRLPQQAGVVVERGADGEQRHVEQRSHRVGEDLLARAAETDQHDPGAGRDDPVGDLLVLARVGGCGTSTPPCRRSAASGTCRCSSVTSFASVSSVEPYR